MKNKIWLTLMTAAMIAIVLLSGFIQDKCGDGICQGLEERKGSCPKDCQVKNQHGAKNIKFLENIGGRLDLSKEDVVVFDLIGTDGYYDVYRMNMDGTKKNA